MIRLSESGEMYALTDLRTGEIFIVSLAEAAERMELDPAEILWAIEEFGVCETARMFLKNLSWSRSGPQGRFPRQG